MTTKEEKAAKILKDAHIDPNQVGDARAAEEKKVEEKVDKIPDDKKSDKK